MPTLESTRLWYPSDDPVHGFDHVLRVYRMAERLAEAEAGNMKIVRAAALLHDVEGSETAGGESGRTGHHVSSAEFARQVLSAEGWDEREISAVEHCIRSHRFRDQTEPPHTLEAKILFDADKLDVIGAVGIIRTVAFAVVAGQPIFAEPSARFLQTGEKEAGEQHSSYHEYLFKLCKVKDMLHTSTARQIAEERHRFMAEFFERMADEIQGRR